MIDLGGSAPDHGHARDTRARLELADIVHHPLGVIHLGTAGHHVWPVETFDEFLIKHRLHRLDGRKRRFELFEERHLQHAGLHRRFVSVVFKNVPAADLDIFDLGQRHKVLDGGATPLRPFSQTDGAELGQRSDRFSDPSLDCFQPGNEGRGYRPHAGYEHAQLAVNGRNLDVFWIGQNTVSF
jgi:hypothetical protein